MNTAMGTAPGTTPVRPAIPAPSTQERLALVLRANGPILLVLAGLVVWIAIRNPNFTNPPVFLAFVKRAAPMMILAAGQFFVVVSGEFDLSVGSLITVVVVVAARLTDGNPANTWWVLVLLAGIGVAVGLVNGTIVGRLRVPSFIATLGMLLILRGSVDYWTGGAPRGALPDNFRQFGRRGFEGVPWLEQVPYSVVILLILGTLAAILASRTDFGRQLFAAGGGARAAMLSGVPVTRVRTVAFVLSGLSAVAAGVLLGGFAGVSAEVGTGYEFQAIAAVVLGGGALGGGRGSVVSAMAGALTLEALFTLLNLLGLPKPLRDAVQGAIIIGAVALATVRSRRSG